jgi:hypothetical protein
MEENKNKGMDLTEQFTEKALLVEDDLDAITSLYWGEEYFCQTKKKEQKFTMKVYSFMIKNDIKNSLERIANALEAQKPEDSFVLFLKDLQKNTAQRDPQSEINNSQSEIDNPQSEINNSQSEI